ncbi:MAG: transposase [Cyclobacteriaceae bacterium]
MTISYKENGDVNKLKLRRITYKDEQGLVYIFITNNFKITAARVALIYRHRWMIEILFKQVKQNFPLNYFWGESENAIRIQVFCVLIAQVLMIVIRKKSKTKRSFTSILTVVRLHIMSYVALLDFLKDTYQAWRSAHDPPLTSRMGIPLSLAFN